MERLVMRKTPLWEMAMTLFVRYREKSRENSPENSLEYATTDEGFSYGRVERALSCSTAMFGMEETGTALMAAPPPRPSQYYGSTSRRWPEQGAEEMANFRNGQRNWKLGCLLFLFSIFFHGILLFLSAYHC
jgi:hypothetical protein